MAGIFGFLDPRGDENTLRRMSGAIAHRGALEAIRCSGAVGIGQRIQQFKSFDNSIRRNGTAYFVALDGDIFNLEELVEILRKKNYQLGSPCESDILLGLYLVFGKEFPKLVKGSFSLAIADGKTLYLARDLLGMRPLFYNYSKDAFFFGSEIKTILQGNTAEEIVEMDMESLYEHFVFEGYLVGDSTYFPHIKHILPGHYCFVKYAGEINAEIGDYGTAAKADFAPDIRLLQEEVARIVKRNVGHYVKRGGSLGVLLSGGFDSSVLAAIAVELSAGKKQIKTFTISDDKNFPDIQAARKVAKHLGTEHHEFIIKTSPEEKDLIEGIHAYEDVIFRDTIFKLARRVKGLADTVLSGTGADILGMPLLARPWLLERARSEWERLQSNLLPRGEHRIKSYMRNFLSALEDNEEKALLEHFIKDYLPQQLFPSSERVLMYFGVEVGFPFADADILPLASFLPAHLKYNESGETKTFLREAFSDLDLPDDIKRRPKLCSKLNLRESKINLGKLAGTLLPDEYVRLHKFASLLPKDKRGVLCFEIFDRIFAKERGQIPKKFSLLDFAGPPQNTAPLFNFQNLLLRIYTDENLRKEFFSHLENVLKRFHLNVREKNALRKLPEKNIELFSRELTNKRINMAKGRLNANADRVVLSSFYKSGPAVFFMCNGSLKIIEADKAILEILRRIGRRMSLRGLYGAILRSEMVSFGSLIAVLKIISKNSLWGREVEIL